uniref:Uncharacterized protein n=1 Tax=Setaria italica TaxID=4555 RepID=K4A4I3_SETIT
MCHFWSSKLRMVVFSVERKAENSPLLIALRMKSLSQVHNHD